MTQQGAFATGVPPNIYAFHRYTRNSPCLYHTLAYQYPVLVRSWAPVFNTRLNKPPTNALRPIIPDNACTLRLTAAAGTELAGASSVGTVIIRPHWQNFTPLRASSFTRRCCVRLSPIAQNSLLLPPVGVWAVSQSHCGWSSSQTSYWSSPW